MVRFSPAPLLNVEKRYAGATLRCFHDPLSANARENATLQRYANNAVSLSYSASFIMILRCIHRPKPKEQNTKRYTVLDGESVAVHALIQSDLGC